MKRELININVTNTLTFDTPISLLGGLSDSFSQSVNAVTQYWWDISFPFFNVALYSQIFLEVKPVGAPTFALATIPTNSSYDGLLAGLNNANLGVFWYEFPIFDPVAGYQIYCTNDTLEFGEFIF
jgi:hypothetical protein